MSVTYKRRLNLGLLDISKIYIIIFHVCKKKQLALGIVNKKKMYYRCQST